MTELHDAHVTAYRNHLASREAVFRLWAELAESAEWPAPTWASRSTAEPRIAAIGSAETGELFAVLDTDARRVLSEDEFPTARLETEAMRELA